MLAGAISGVEKTDSSEGVGGLGWGVNQWWEGVASEQRPGGREGVSLTNTGKEHPDQVHSAAVSGLLVCS